MIALWMGYAVVVALLLGFAAFALERAFTLHGRPVRWVWSAALAGSWLVPILTWFTASSASAPAELKAVEGPAGGGTAVDPAVVLTLLEQASTLGAGAVPLLRALGDALLAGWIGLAVVALGLFGMAVRRVVRRSRRWPEAELHGDRVRVSDDFGPAVVGVHRPSIVLPRWVFSLEESAVRMVLRHEQEHRSARDTLLLTLALVLVLAAPWNLPLWWHFRRLRMAVELDCDRRVLRSGVSPRRYGDLLLDVGERLGRTAAPAAALAEPPSFLERRVKMIAERKTSGRGWKSAVAVMLAAGIVGVACETPAPTRPDDETVVKGEEAGVLQRGADAVASFFTRDMPLVVVDGEEWDEGLGALDLSTIESIEVVRGSAAEVIYGERAAHGAVQITTKGFDPAADGEFRAVELPEGAEPVKVAGQVAAEEREAVATLREMTATGVPEGGETDEARGGRFTVEEVEGRSGRLEELVNRAVTGEPVRATYRIEEQPSAGDRVDPESAENEGVLLDGSMAISGSSSPLIVVDGVITDHTLADISSLDVKSIEVVKGEEARRLYGEQSRAANGVVRITTHEGPERR